MAECRRCWSSNASSQCTVALRARARVGGQVLTAIRDDRFYIFLTRPEWNGTMEQRLRAILAGDNPSVLPPPGFESLMQKLAAITGGQGST